MTEGKENEINELEISQKQFGRVVTVSIIIGIAVLSGLIIYFILNPEPGYVGFGILNEDKKAEDYPTEVKVGENIEFYVTVGNFLNEDFTFRVKILKGDNETSLKSTGSKNADLNSTTGKKTLESGETWISDKLSISFTQNGSKQILIVEVWQISKDNDKEFYNILWLRLNVTS